LGFAQIKIYMKRILSSVRLKFFTIGVLQILLKLQERKHKQYKSLSTFCYSYAIKWFHLIILHTLILAAADYKLGLYSIMLVNTVWYFEVHLHAIFHIPTLASTKQCCCMFSGSISNGSAFFHFFSYTSILLFFSLSWGTFDIITIKGTFISLIIQNVLTFLGFV